MPFDLSAQFNSSFIDYLTLTKDLLAVSKCHSFSFVLYKLHVFFVYFLKTIAVKFVCLEDGTRRNKSNKFRRDNAKTHYCLEMECMNLFSLVGAIYGRI